MLAGTAMAQDSPIPFSRNKLTMWAGKAAVTAIVNTTKTPTSRNGALSRSARSGTPLAGDIGPATPRACGAFCRRKKWIGAQTRNCSAASHHKAWRHPKALISHAVKGMNTVLARPPRKVMVMMARR